MVSNLASAMENSQVEACAHVRVDHVGVDGMGVCHGVLVSQGASGEQGPSLAFLCSPPSRAQGSAHHGHSIHVGGPMGWELMDEKQAILKQRRILKQEQGV